MLAMGILAAVISSIKTGKGQVIDSAMIDGSLSLMSFFYSLKQVGFWQDERESNFLDGAAHFYNTYQCSDNKYLAVGSLEPQFYSILLEKLELNDDKFQDQMNKEIWQELKLSFLYLYWIKRVFTQNKHNDIYSLYFLCIFVS